MATSTIKATQRAKARRQVRSELGAQPTAAVTTEGVTSTSTSTQQQQQLLNQRLRLAAEAHRKLTSQALKKDASTLRANVSAALSQALHTEDSAMLAQVLRAASGPSSELRLASVERLNPALALVLLRRCTEIFQLESSGRAQEVVPWVRDILRCHATFLMCQPEVPALLAPVAHVIKDHLAAYERLRMLQGRLELLLARVTHGSEVALSAVPLQAYEEEDGDVAMGEGDMNLPPDALLQAHLGKLGSHSNDDEEVVTPFQEPQKGGDNDEDEDDEDSEDVEVEEDN